jgi:hypothetical protein
LIPRLSIRASAIYDKQEAISAIREEGIVPNKATKSKHYHARGFLNLIALLNRISFDAPINIIINFLYSS